MKRVLVTGAGGYIGTTLVPMLLARGLAVRAVDRLFFGRDLLRPHPKLELLQEDSRRLTLEHFRDVDAVIDLVALSNDPSAALFTDATWAINRDSRIRTCGLARRAGVRRYVLPSSCSVYGFQDHACTEEDAPNPLTVYAEANLQAENGVLDCASDRFTVVVLRQSTVFGYSPRMRFDLAINGMTYGAWKTGKLPLMRDGSQWRPMVHVRDTAAAQVFMLDYADARRINGQIFNVGARANNFQIGALGHRVATAVPRDVQVSWYGDPDHRSYRVVFDKIEALGWRATRTVEDAVAEICERLDAGVLDKTDRTITLRWYQLLAEWSRILHGVELHGGLLDIEAPARRVA